MTNEWYAELREVASLASDTNSAYIKLGRIYRRILDEATADTSVLLVGNFAKTDYLLKEYSATSQLKRMVNDMRLRLKDNNKAQSFEVFKQDFQALCLFVELLTKNPVPKNLLALFPSEFSRRESTFQLLGEYLRVVVNSVDDTYIYCTGETTIDELRVLYLKDEKRHSPDFSYLKDILNAGDMLNLIRPQLCEDNVVVAELIIFDPDYLVDVSTIVSCIDSYAKSPIVGWLRRLEPSVSSEAILMGNMAGELLDSVLYSHSDESSENKPSEQGYRTSAINFFRKNILGILSVNPSKLFHQQAWLQYVNIHQAITQNLPSLISRYDSTKVVVEPTFFSEMLGIQGRMDMLQTDMRVLVEQKSGKGDFVFGHTDMDVPRHREEHYMQMLLYMAIIRYNFRHIYDENNHELHAFLLYSKYKRPLLGLGFAPELLAEAFKLRNLYVAQERDICRHGATFLFDKTPEDVNLNQIDGKLWTQYVRPRIDTLLAKIQQSAPLEKAYFNRFYQFVANEHRLSKIGNQTKENSGFASAWHSTLDEKRQSGTIITDLQVELPSDVDYQKFTHVSLTYQGDFGNFRQGDVIVLYSYPKDEAPDLRKSMIHRATIERISSTSILLKLRNAQTDRSSFFSSSADVLWCIEHDFMESSYSGLYKGLYAFLSAPQSHKELFLARRRPSIACKKVKGHYGAFQELQQRIKNASDLFLLVGPPGTGKTSYGMLNTLQEELMEDDARVLIVSYTNRAVDEICSKLHPQIDFLRLGGEYTSSLEYANNLFSTHIATCKSAEELKQRFLSTRVIVGTVASITSHLSLVGMKPFSLCIIDEASQILEPYLLPMISLRLPDGVPCIGKFVMIGDHKQLPAVVQQRSSESFVCDPLLRDISLLDCRDSLFERMLRLYRNDDNICFMLTRQGRMHHEIAEFPNKHFYQGQLQVVPLHHQLTPSSEPRVKFIHVTPYANSLSDNVNIAEAELVVDHLINIWEKHKEDFHPDETVGVIVPYRNQISAILTILAGRLEVDDHPLMHVTIDTVERFQGSQRKYIIYSFTVQRDYQLRFLTETNFLEDGQLIDRKLNVAMTRAQEYLIMIGNRVVLSKNPLYAQLIHTYLSE